MERYNPDLIQENKKEMRDGYLQVELGLVNPVGISLEPESQSMESTNDSSSSSIEESLRSGFGCWACSESWKSGSNWVSSMKLGSDQMIGRVWEKIVSWSKEKCSGMKKKNEEGINWNGFGI